MNITSTIAYKYDEYSAEIKRELFIKITIHYEFVKSFILLFAQGIYSITFSQCYFTKITFFSKIRIETWNESFNIFLYLFYIFSTLKRFYFKRIQPICFLSVHIFLFGKMQKESVTQNLSLHLTQYTLIITSYNEFNISLNFSYILTYLLQNWAKLLLKYYTSHISIYYIIWKIYLRKWLLY